LDNIKLQSKRGYYQLRGEEEVENHNDGKKKTFEILQVKEIIETGDIITSTGAKLYKVIFENDWEYDKSIVKVTEWQGKVKEFIVTTSSLKNGEIKRTYKEVDSEDDWTAIKAKTEKDIEQSGKHIGQYIYEALLKNRNQKIRGKLIKTIERKYYKAELEAILEKQTEFHPELRDKELYKRCINELYPENIGHQKNVQDKDEFFKYLFIEDIIFYQRPLKSKKSTIGNCQYETRYYIDKDTKEKKEAPLKGIPKSHPLFQEFRLWQFLSNLKIYEKEGFEQGKTVLNKDITTKLLPDENAWVALFDFLNELKEVEQHQVLKYFSDKKLIPRQTKEHPELRWNYPEDKKYPMNETKALFLGRLKNVKGIRPNDFLTPDIETHLWHIIYSVKDKNEYMKALGKFADRYGINKESFVEAFIKIPPFSNEYGAYSNKALRKLLPLMRMGKYWDEHKIKSTTLERIHKVLSGEYDPTIRDRVRENFFHFKSIDSFRGLPTWLASYIVYDRHSEVKTISRWKKPSDLDEYLMQFKQHSLKNPIVEQIVMETLRVVRDIWVHFGNGAEGYFDEIHLELGRSMKNPKQIRERISKKNAENETTNQRIKSILEELIHDGIENVKSYSPSHQEILKIYEEGVYSNSPEEYSKIKLEEIDKIRKTVSPSKREIQRYKLWLEQGYVSPYTGEPIALSDLFSKNYQIEHIIPQSRYFDDSLNNKVICESIINPNPYKDNQTGYEFIKIWVEVWFLNFQLSKKL
jgi:CRISPR-associated endonuclease Csn1